MAEATEIVHWPGKDGMDSWQKLSEDFYREFAKKGPLRAEIAALREPMSCTHPKACWQATKPDSVDAVVGYRCVDCEHERLAVAAAIDKTEELFVKILRGELPAMAANNCDAVAQSIDAHDADTRNRALEEAARLCDEYGRAAAKLGFMKQSSEAAYNCASDIRARKREKRGGE